VVAPSGEVCGQLPDLGDANSGFFLGRDGTLIALGGANRCVISYYPRLLE